MQTVKKERPGPKFRQLADEVSSNLGQDDSTPLFGGAPVIDAIAARP
jgi:hypothetical protein